jgi:hypothetical protein
MKELLKLGLEGFVDTELARLSGLVGEVGEEGVARPRCVGNDMRWNMPGLSEVVTMGMGRVMDA